MPPPCKVTLAVAWELFTQGCSERRRLSEHIFFPGCLLGGATFSLFRASPCPLRVQVLVFV